MSATLLSRNHATNHADAPVLNDVSALPAFPTQDEALFFSDASEVPLTHLSS
jgi:hypothetical protein